jgi:hypothetical protein
METDHIRPVAEGGNDSISNAIPVCFDCHAEIHSYNDKHPRGRKFTSRELERHKEQWLKLCSERPPSAPFPLRESDRDVGPLQALVDEIEYNLAVADFSESNVYGCPFRVEQFARAIGTGSIAILAQELKNSLYGAYVDVERANTLVVAAATKRAAGVSHSFSGVRGFDPIEAIRRCRASLQNALDQLLKFLGHEHGDTA